MAIKQTLLCILFVFTVSGIAAQDALINLHLDNFTRDHLIIGEYAGEQLIAIDTLHQSPSDSLEFILYQSDFVYDGSYLIISFQDKKFFDILLHNADKNIAVNADFNALEKRSVTNSKHNQDFLLYLNDGFKYSKFAKKSREIIDNPNLDEFRKKAAQKALDKRKDERAFLRSKIMSDNPESILYTILANQRGIQYPEFEGEENEIILKKYSHRLAKYFGNVENDPRFFNTRYFKDMVKKYVEEYTVQQVDSLYKSLDYILEMTRPRQDVYHFYLVEWINKYGQSNVMRQEEILVNLVLEHLKKDTTDFIPKNQRRKLIGDAETQKNCLIGAKAKNLKMDVLDLEGTLEMTIDPENKKYYKLDGKIALDTLAGHRTVIFFWKPNCGHCQKAYPKLVQAYKKYKDEGLKVFAVNVGNYKKYQEAAQFITDKGGEIFPNLVDPNYTSRYAKYYKVTQTPAIFILDENKEILYNRMGASQLTDMIDKSFKTAE